MIKNESLFDLRFNKTQYLKDSDGLTWVNGDKDLTFNYWGPGEPNYL
jgi:hypothetical protein